MMGYEDFVSGGVKVSIVLMIRGVFEENIRGGAGNEFMWYGSGEVWIVNVFKDTEMRIGKGTVVENFMWGFILRVVVGRIMSRWTAVCNDLI